MIAAIGAARPLKRPAATIAVARTCAQWPADRPVSGTINPITSLQMCDPKPEAEMVIYPGVGHFSWQMTYDLPAGHDIYAWLLEHYKP